MRFSSLPFLFGFLPVTLAIDFLAPPRQRNLVLLLTSLFFYGWGEPVYLGIMILSIAIDYTHGLLVERFRSRDALAQWFVAQSVLLNLGLLGFFKYWDFLAGTLSALGIPLPQLGLPLPIGISFFTFQTMSYTIDVYRRDAPVQRDPVAFGAYVTMFPQLVAGPIVRYRDVAAELAHRVNTTADFAAGAERFTVGLAKKVLLANGIGTLWDTQLAALHQGTLTLCGGWLGLAAYGFQIYFDFSGYSDMAIGMGRMLGFHFPENFRYPYLADSVSEFWRRWHISLTTWFREYLYIPLGGNRRGRWQDAPQPVCGVALHRPLARRQLEFHFVGAVLLLLDCAGEGAARRRAAPPARVAAPVRHAVGGICGLGALCHGGSGRVPAVLCRLSGGGRTLECGGRLSAAELCRAAGAAGGGLHPGGESPLAAHSGAGKSRFESAGAAGGADGVHGVPCGWQLQSVFIFPLLSRGREAAE